MRYLDPQLADRLAAEYVLGTLKGAARRRFVGLVQAHPALRSHVRAWEERLSRLIGAVPPVAPPPDTWQAIQRRLFPDAVPAPWYRRPSLWRWWSLGSSMLAAVLAGLLLFTPIKESTPAYVVMISDAAEKPLWLLSTSADMENLYAKSLKPMDMPKDVRCLLWLRPKGSERVYPLGILPDQGDDRLLRIEEEMRRMLPGELLVTVEHVPGEVPPAPGSPPVYEGQWVALAGI